MNGFVENRKVLYIDDEDSILLSFRSLMRNQNMDVYTQNGQLLLRRSATLTETICKLLNQWGNLDPIVSPVHVLLNQDGE